MNNRKLRTGLFSTVILSLLFSPVLHSQTGNAGDSLSLEYIIKEAVTTHPTVRAAEEAVRNADARIGLARTGYYPEADVTAGYSNLGPVTKLTIPDMGTFQLFPENNYSAAVNYRQVVYDFGRTRQNIEIETENKYIGEQALEQVKQKLSLYAVNNYFSLLFLQSAIKIKEEQIATLNEHLRQVEKMMATGSSTEYQVLATKVRISVAESQKVDLLAGLAAQQAAMNSLLGNDNSLMPVVKSRLRADMPMIPRDSIFSFAYHNRDEALLNEKKISLAELRYGMAKIQNRPVISFQASAGAKNGYVPYLNEIKPNYVVGLALRIPVFDGLKTKYNVLQAQSAINSLSYESESTRRTISNELLESEAYIEAAEKKVTQFELQMEQALKAYSLAETSFRSGMVTNLDLLDANSAVSESRLLMLKARIDYAASIYKLKAALGERLY